MTDLDALLRAILAHPDDDTPRLIYADALEDVGESDRAALIRAQVELARAPEYEPSAVQIRTSEAYREQLAAAIQWLFAEPELPGALKWAREPFRRGFPAAIQADNGAAFVAHAEELFGRFPVELLVLGEGLAMSDTAPLARCEWLSRITTLEITPGITQTGATRLLNSRHLTRLTDLHVGSGLTTPGATHQMIHSKAFRGLTGFSCRDDSRQGTVVNLLTSLADPPHLRRLDLSGNRLTAHRLTPLTTSPLLAEVEELDLSHNNLGPEGVTALAGARLPRLRALRLLRVRARDAGVRALVASGLMGELRSLHLEGNLLSPAAAGALVGAAAAENLRVLDLTDNPLGDDGAAALAGSPHLRNLILLDLAQNLIEDRGAYALAESPHLGGLVYLNLPNNVISPEAARRLRKRFGERVYLGERGA
jgi:uncharacterized protein (TIGR02996 family)